MMTVLTFDCRFAYPTGFALDFAFNVDAGVTGLVGPSGCGKTTVLNLISGLLRPDSGRIALGDQDLFDAKKRTDRRPEERQIGYVFQDFLLFPHLSVEDNLRYGQQRQKDCRIEFQRVVAALELGDVLRRMPASLSGGQKQRVALGRALMRSPQLLLLDEPLNALDRELRASVIEDLAKIVDELEIPAIVVSHDQASIAALEAHVVAMSQTGSPGS